MENILKFREAYDFTEVFYISALNGDNVDKLYKKDTFEVEPAGEYTEDSRTFKNGLCVYNNRLGMAYSVTEIVEVLNSLVEYKDLVSELFDAKIEALEDELERSVKAGMPTSILYDELDELETLKKELMELWYR